MNKDRFDYLMDTLPWNLSEEDLREANQIKEQTRPALYAYFLEQFKDAETLRSHAMGFKMTKFQCLPGDVSVVKRILNADD